MRGLGKIVILALLICLGYYFVVHNPTGKQFLIQIKEIGSTAFVSIRAFFYAIFSAK